MSCQARQKTFSKQALKIHAIPKLAWAHVAAFTYCICFVLINPVLSCNNEAVPAQPQTHTWNLLAARQISLNEITHLVLEGIPSLSHSLLYSLSLSLTLYHSLLLFLTFSYSLLRSLSLSYSLSLSLTLSHSLSYSLSHSFTLSLTRCRYISIL